MHADHTNPACAVCAQSKLVCVTRPASTVCSDAVWTCQVPEVITSGYKWLRAVCEGEFTGVHADKVFLGRGSPRVLTAWVPLGQVSPIPLASSAKQCHAVHISNSCLDVYAMSCRLCVSLYTSHTTL